MGRLNRRRTVHDLPALFLTIASVAASPVLAQSNWPERQIKILVPRAAGGNTDTIARLVAERLHTALPATVVVENQPGGGGAIATQAVARSTPDGYTLLLADTPQVAIVPVLQPVAFDPVKHLQPIKNIAFNPFVLVVNRSVAATNLHELIDLGKREPGKLTYASGGQGGISHLSSALLFAKAGVSAVHVAYRGTAPAQADVVAGHVPMIFSNLSDALPQTGNPDLRFMAVSSLKRTALLPDVPTVAELVLPGFDTVAWNGLLGPAGLPQPIADRLEAVLTAFVRDPSTQKRFQDLGLEPDTGSSADFAKQISADIIAWGEGIRLAGIK